MIATELQLAAILSLSLFSTHTNVFAVTDDSPSDGNNDRKDHSNKRNDNKKKKNDTGSAMRDKKGRADSGTCISLILLGTMRCISL